MSSIDITSTNDMTSTAAASETSGSFAGNASQRMTHAITTDAIIRECIKQGFYRNPICNEKLYLHNRGFDSVAPTAFEPYTDVKVLWLEGNGFATLPCGQGYTQVQPPVRVDPFAELAEPLAAGEERHVDPFSLGQPTMSKESTALPLAADVPPEERDVFSSLYPTVRQLYLHNNLFRVMPDLSRFQRLDSVNLSGNFFTAIEPSCVSRVKKEEGGVSAVDAAVVAAEKEEVALIPAPADAKAQREAQLEAHRRTADAYAANCEHCPLPEPEGEDKEKGEARDERGRPLFSRPHVPRQPPMPDPEYRNPCSSLRSLNVAGNRLESFDDCLGLLSYKALAVLDLSHNNIVDGEALLLILERLPRLQSLKLSGNPLVRTLPRYRKRLLARCKRLLYLDDRPVFEEERRLVTAWALAGNDGEEKERHLIQQEKAAAERKRLDDFRRLIARSQEENSSSGSGGEGPHADYVRAITTTAALSAASDTAGGAVVTTTTTTTTTPTNGSRGAAPEASRRTHRTAALVRRPSSDPDNSPTSSESDSEDDEAAEASGTRNDSVQSDVIAPLHESSNKPERQAATCHSPARVLSSNQRVEPHHVSNHDDDEGADDDIFIPQS